jgi:hypothetical protein
MLCEGECLLSSNYSVSYCIWVPGLKPTLESCSIYSVYRLFCCNYVQNRGDHLDDLCIGGKLILTKWTPCLGGLEYPASCRRRRKWNPMPGGIIWPPCHWEEERKYRDLILQVGGWAQGCRSCSVKKLLLRNPKN